MTTFRKGEVSDLVYHSQGGANSPLREPITVQLGNPTTNEVYVSPELRKYAGEVYLFDIVGDFSLADTEDTERDDSPPAVFTGFLPSGSLPSGKRKYGTTVKAVWREGRYEVVRETVAGANYNEGVPEVEHSAVTVKDIDYGLLRPTDGPSGRVVLSGARHPIDATWYDIPLQTSNVDLIATYAAALTLGQAIAVQIEVDPTTNAIVYTAGSAFTNTSRDAETGAVDHSSVFSNYPVGADATLKHYGWVLLYYQMTVITEQDILVTPDYGRGGSGAVDATDVTYTPGDATDWDSDTDPGDVDDALDQLAGRVTDLEDAGGGSVYSACKVEYQPGSGWFEIDPFDVWQVAWNLTALWDTDLYFNNAESNILTVPTDGYYELFARVECVLLDTTAVTTYVDMYLYAAFDEGGTGSGLPGGRTRGYIPSGVEDDVVMEVHARGDLLLATDPVVKLYIYNQTDVSLQVRFAELVIERKSAPRA